MSESIDCSEPRALRQSVFDPVAWLRAFAEIGGGYALTSAGKLCLIVGDCDAEDLTRSMAELVGQQERQEAVKLTIALRQVGEVR